MSFDINTNISSLQAQQYLNKSSAFQSTTIQKVTSGLRIVSSGDDAAGLAIANGLRSDQAVLTQGVRNANDGLSQLQIADGGINNISQLLDRARTLATQSASGTFTGDRGVLNSEFQSVVGEINRQAQAIGLDQNGAFAKNLQVFIGGGKTNNGISQIANGSEALDLSKSTVDARSLGLTGVVATGKTGTDIGTGSANTSLASILGNSANTTSTPGFSTFVLRGPGFDGNGVKISVNTSNLGGTSDLVSAVNAAISSAENNGTQAGTALKNANITASINTDSSGKQQLAFSSSTAAFQVQAGDKLSNALLGNFQQNASLTGTDSSAFIDTTTNNQLKVAVDGGSLITVNLSTTAPGTSKGEIVKELNANATFAGAATASLNNNQIVIKSNSNSSSSAVAITTTGLSTALGLTGSATAGAASTGGDLTTTVQGAGAVQANANIVGTDAAATATVSATANNLTLSIGAGAAQTITLSNNGVQSKSEIAADINTQIAANGTLNGKLTASVVSNKIVLTATDPTQSVTVGTPASNSLNAALGFTNNTTSTSHTLANSDTISLRFQGSGLASPVDITLDPTTGGTTTSANVLADLQSKISTNSALQGAGITLSTSSVGNNLVFSSSSGQTFQVLASGDSQNVLGLGSFQAGSGADLVDYTSTTAANAYSTATSGAGPAKLEISLNGLASSGNQISVNLSGAGTDAIAASTLGTASGSATGATSGTTTGTVAAVAGDFDLSAAAANAKLNIGVDGHTFSLNVGNSATTSAAGLVTAINTAIGSLGTASLSGANKLVLTSASTGVSSTIQVLGSSDANVLTALGLTAGTNAGASGSGAFDLSGAAGGAGSAINLTIDGTHSFSVALGNSATQSASSIAAAFNSVLGSAGTASIDGGGHLVLKSATTGGNSSINISNTSDAGLLTALGLTAGAATTAGANASSANVVNQINTAIASNSSLADAGLQASVSGGKIQLTSNNNTFFRVSAFGAGDLGFGNAGSTFTGNAQSAAPAVNQYVDSQGAQATASLAYTDTLYGGDNQTIAITGVDAAGAKHSIGLTLENNTTSRAQTIDQAVSQINTKLQQSNDSTLNQIVAVKENNGGTQSIKFLSTLSNFQVSVGADANGTGITPPTGSVANATTLGQGQTASVDSQTNAAAAVTALANSVSLLGNAQAVVGRGENQFNYAVNLAQSQLTNLAAAESRIRDADLASEAANLTKSQILVQAGVAALAQANSAPQQILSLLRG